MARFAISDLIRLSERRSRRGYENSTDSLASQSGKSGEGQRHGKSERLFGCEHYQPLGATSQRQISDDCLSLAGRAGLCGDAPPYLADLGAAELGEARDDGVLGADGARLGVGESEPAAHGRFKIGLAFSRHHTGQREPPSAVVGLNPSGISRRVPAFGFGCRLCFGHEPCRCQPNFLDRIVGIAGPPHTLAMAATAASECDPPFVSVRYFYFGGIDQRLEDPRIGDQHDIANWNQIGSAPEVPPPPGPVAHFVRWRAPRRESPKICNAPSAQNPAQPSLALVNMQTVSSRSGTTLVNEM